jgi:hypothetical protein
MITILDEYVPLEIANLIYKKFHRDCMKDIGIILRYKIVFVIVGERLSFLICEGQSYENYYDPLLSSCD